MPFPIERNPTAEHGWGPVVTREISRTSAIREAHELFCLTQNYSRLAQNLQHGQLGAWTTAGMFAVILAPYALKVANHVLHTEFDTEILKTVTESASIPVVTGLLIGDKLKPVTTLRQAVREHSVYRKIIRGDGRPTDIASVFAMSDDIPKKSEVRQVLEMGLPQQTATLVRIEDTRALLLGEYLAQQPEYSGDAPITSQNERDVKSRVLEETKDIVLETLDRKRRPDVIWREVGKNILDSVVGATVMLGGVHLIQKAGVPGELATLADDVFILGNIVGSKVTNLTAIATQVLSKIHTRK